MDNANTMEMFQTTCYLKKDIFVLVKSFSMTWRSVGLAVNDVS
jgi:hypothetical protein